MNADIPSVEIHATPGTSTRDGLLANRQFRGVALTVAVSAMSVGGSRFVFVWLIGELTEWDTATAILGILIGLPPLLLSAWAGSLADRLDPNRLGRTLLIASTLLFGAVATLTSADAMTVPLAMGCAFVTAIAPSMLMPLLQALVPSIVRKERLMQAVAIQNLAMMFSMIAATFVCGAVIQLFGIAAGFWFLTIASGIAVVRYSMTGLPTRLSGDRHGQPTTVRDAARQVLRGEPLRSLLALTFMMGMAAGTTMLLLPEFARDVLGTESFAAGALSGLMSIGVMITTLLIASRWTPTRPGAVCVFFMSTGLGTGLVLIGVSRAYAVTALIAFLWGASGGVAMTLLRTLTQLHTPSEIMGRVMGLATTAMNGAAPVAAVFLVVLVNSTGLSAALVISGLVYSVLVWTITFLSPLRRM